MGEKPAASVAGAAVIVAAPGAVDVLASSPKAKVKLRIQAADMARGSPKAVGEGSAAGLLPGACVEAWPSAGGWPTTETPASALNEQRPTGSSLPVCSPSSQAPGSHEAFDVKAEVRREVDSQRAELLMETTRSVDKTVQEEVRRSQLQALEEQRERDEQIRLLLAAEVAKAREESRAAASEMLELMKQREESMTQRAMEMSATVERVMADAKNAEQQHRVEAETAMRKLEEQREAERLKFERELERRTKELERDKKRKELEMKAERKAEQVRSCRREQELKEEVLQMKLQARQVGEAMVRSLEEGDLMRPPSWPNFDPPCDSARSMPLPRSHSRLHEAKAFAAGCSGDQEEVATASMSEPAGSSRCSCRLWEAVHGDLHPEGSTRSPTRKFLSSACSSISSLKSARRSSRSSAPQLRSRSRPSSANLRGRPPSPGYCRAEGAVSFKRTAEKFNRSSCESDFEKWQSSTQKSRSQCLGLHQSSGGRGNSSHRGGCPHCRAGG